MKWYMIWCDIRICYDMMLYTYDMLWYYVIYVWYVMILCDIRICYDIVIYVWYMLWYDVMWYTYDIWYDVIYVWYVMIWCDIRTICYDIMWYTYDICYDMWYTYDIWYDVIYVWYMLWYDVIYVRYMLWYVIYVWYIWCDIRIIYDMMWYTYDMPNPDTDADTPAAGSPKQQWRTLQRSVMKSCTSGSKSGVIDSLQEIVPSFSLAVTVPQGSTTWKQRKFLTSLQYQGNNHGKTGAMLFR